MKADIAVSLGFEVACFDLPFFGARTHMFTHELMSHDQMRCFKNKPMIWIFNNATFLFWYREA